MSETMDYLRRGEYVRRYTRIHSSEAEKGIIYVEDSSDVAFWNKVLKAVCPDRYDIKFYSGGKQGKRMLEKEYGRVHKDFLVAVDSNFDYLCPDRNVYAGQLNDNPYILHTVFYSRESYIALPESLDDLTESVMFSEKIDCEMQQAIERYSVISCEAVKLFSFLHNKDQASFSEGDFNQCLKIPANTSLLNDHLKMDENIFSQLIESVNKYVERHSSFIEGNEEYRLHLASLERKKSHQKMHCFSSMVITS